MTRRPRGRLVEQARWADFEDYVRAGQQRHKRLAYLLTGDLNEAEDLLQSAYASVCPRWAQVREYDSPDAYLRRTMVNLRTSWWRRALRRERPVETVPDVVGSGADLGDGVAEGHALLSALRALPERQRAAVVLRHWCDLSEAETAATMGCSTGTVKSTTSRGLAALRIALAPPTGESEDHPPSPLPPLPQQPPRPERPEEDPR